MGRCPLCNVEMREVSVRANPGQMIVLDQCGTCGGIWCDKWELFPTDPNEATRLDPVDEALLQSPVTVDKKTHYCPRCRDRLQIFREPILPADLQLERCRRCEGIWLNRGQFARYKSLQKKTRVEKLGEAETFQRFVQAYTDPSSWVTTGTRGIFAYPRGEEEAEDLGRYTLKGTVRLMLQTLLRMFLPF